MSSNESLEAQKVDQLPPALLNKESDQLGRNIFTLPVSTLEATSRIDLSAMYILIFIRTNIYKF
jgi:hypothetical protein